jgi:hypothetical protein|eukprot:COSAG01_NODE_1354_length_10598_cov_6.459758_7_plen_116_part_00
MIMRLMAINAEEKARRYPADQPRERHLIDLSQRSDQDNFRNEHRTDHRGRKMPFDLEQDDWAVGREPKDGESFLRVHWVAVPKAMRARRVNRAAGVRLLLLQRQPPDRQDAANAR